MRQFCNSSTAVLWIRDDYRGSRIRLIFYPGSELFPSRIPDLHKKFKYFNPKKWFPDPDFLPVPDPGSRGQKGTGSRIRFRNTGKQFGGIKQTNKNALQDKYGQLCGRIFERNKDKKIYLETESIVLNESVKKVEIQYCTLWYIEVRIFIVKFTKWADYFLPHWSKNLRKSLQQYGDCR